ncbi:MAG: hypothetical protein M1833_007361 [Piccolia ochrophora]|nr:MAG: hypothetical protein M1833_007361 [Piccolia ochrophora]
MFTHSAPSPPTISTSTSLASPTSPSRTGRLRGLSYLRNYTHSHRLSFSGSAGPASNPPAEQRPDSPRTPTPSGIPSPTDQLAHQFSQISLSPHRSTSDFGEGPDSQARPGATSGWLPTVGGLSGLSRVATEPQSTSTPARTAYLAGTLAPESELAQTMGRTRSSTAAQTTRTGLVPSYSASAREFARLDGPSPQPTGPSWLPPGAHNAPAEEASSRNMSMSQMPSIRFTAHQDTRSSRPSLEFAPTARTLPSSSAVIRVGRYSEKDNPTNPLPNAPSAAPVGFKSKVVSRRHCEFWCSAGQWYIKDVKSSSGTFLNHIRLSQPGIESKPWPVNDGDVVQLGIDFKGGEEMIFRCVKIRVECNRGWQKALNNFNTSTHLQLRNLAAQNGEKKDSDTGSTHSSECSICLYSIAPCQSLFVAPCSHVWHYKCIRPILNGTTWPQFLCPNCRAVTDLEAEIEDPGEEWKTQVEGFRTPKKRADRSTDTIRSQTSRNLPSTDTDMSDSTGHEEALSTMIGSVSLEPDAPPSRTAPRDSTHTQREARSTSHPLRASNSNPAASPDNDVPSTNTSSRPSPDPDHEESNETHLTPLPTQPIPTPAPSRGPSSSTEIVAGDGPLTPRNDAGPFVFDGSAGRAQGRRALANLSEAAGSEDQDDPDATNRI